MRLTSLLCLPLVLLPACNKQTAQKDLPPSGGTPMAQQAQTPPPPAYRTQELGAVTLAAFEGWKTVPIRSDAQGNVLVMSPPGQESEFDLTVMMPQPAVRHAVRPGTAFIQSAAPGLQRIGESKRGKLGSDDAMFEEYGGTVGAAQQIKARVVYVRKGDIAVIVMGRGTEQAFAQHSAKVDLVAQSVSVKSSDIDPQLVGKWAMNKTVASGLGAGNAYSKSEIITIYADGSFARESSEYSDRLGVGNEQTKSTSGRGKISRRANLLTFTYDDGRTENASYELISANSLNLDNVTYKRQ